MSKGVLIIAAIIAVPLAIWWLLSALSEARQARPPAPAFVFYVGQPKPALGSVRAGNWDGPLAVAAIGDRLFVLDSGNDRVLELDDSGRVVAVLCESGECGFLLKRPQAMAAHNGQLYVANTAAGQVVVLSPDGSPIETIGITVPGGSEGEKVSPAGIAVSRRGDVYVSDTKRDLVVRLGGEDRLWSVFLESRAQSQKYRAVGPAGLTLDGDDNLYVANGGDGTIRMYSPEGRHLQEFSMRSNPRFFSPAYVAVDPAGDVYFTDNRGRMVYVYAPSGDLVGTVGSLDATRVDSPAVLRDPQGMQWRANTLYVADRSAGVFGFRIDPGYWNGSRPTGSWSHP